MYKKVFFDANILIDIIDPKRPQHEYSVTSLMQLLTESESQLYTSCDLITTVYYLASKVDRKLALAKIEYFNKIFEIVDFSNYEVSIACDLMHEENYRDLEDTIQYVLAKKENCDIIVTNDKSFVSNDIPIATSEAFCELLGC